MDCPKCVGKTEEIKVGDLVIDRCFACGGLWFDKGELFTAINKEIIDTVEFELEEGHFDDEELKELIKEIDLDKKEIICPRCKGDKKMIKIPSPRNKNITIDYCEKCEGIWLDAGEYNKLRKRSPLEEKIENISDFFRLHFPHIFKDSK